MLISTLVRSDLSVSPDLDVGLRFEGVAADGQDVQVVPELTHPLEKVDKF